MADDVPVDVPPLRRDTRSRHRVKVGLR